MALHSQQNIPTTNHRSGRATFKCLSVCNFLTFFAELHGSTEAVKLPVAVIRGRVCVWGKQQNKTTTNNDENAT